MAACMGEPFEDRTVAEMQELLAQGLSSTLTGCTAGPFWEREAAFFV